MTLHSAPMRLGADRGFTLIEVVIALSLLSLIMLGLISAMSTFGATASRMDERAGKDGSAWQVGIFLKASLAQSARNLKQTLPDGTKAVFFRGGPHALFWLGNMPARYGVGGMHFFWLSEGDVRGQLVLRYAPFASVDAPPDPQTAATHLLLEGVSDFRVTYESKPRGLEEGPQWTDAWADAERLPARVRLDLAVDGRPWPPLFFTLAEVDSAGSTRIVSGAAE